MVRVEGGLNMKRTRVKHYVGLDARSAAELGEMLTQKCEELRQFCPEVVWDLSNGHSAFLVYDEVVEEPENIRDEYALRGETYSCGDCPFKYPITDGRSRHRWACERSKSGTDEDIPACNWFYEQLDKGEVFK